MYILQTNGIVNMFIGLEKNVDDSIKNEVIYIEGEIPSVELVPGKNPIFKYDSTNNSVYVEYVDRPLTPEEQAKRDLEALKTQNAQMLLVLVEGGLM